MKIWSIIFLFLLTTASFGQNNANRIDSIAKKYFTTIPTGNSINEIVGSLERNISLKIDTTIRQTDTSRFYLRGYTSDFNPFAIPATKIEIQMRVAVIKKKPPTANDTLLILQVIAPIDSSPDITKMLRSEVHGITKNLNKLFDKVLYKRSKSKDKIPFESFIYFILPEPYHELVIGWGGYYLNSSIHCISLSLSCKISATNN